MTFLRGVWILCGTTHFYCYLRHVTTCDSWAVINRTVLFVLIYDLTGSVHYQDKANPVLLLVICMAKMEPS